MLTFWKHSAVFIHSWSKSRNLRPRGHLCLQCLPIPMLEQTTTETEGDDLSADLAAKREDHGDSSNSEREAPHTLFLTQAEGGSASAHLWVCARGGCLSVGREPLLHMSGWSCCFHSWAQNLLIELAVIHTCQLHEEKDWKETQSQHWRPTDILRQWRQRQNFGASQADPAEVQEGCPPAGQETQRQAALHTPWWGSLAGVSKGYLAVECREVAICSKSSQDPPEETLQLRVHACPWLPCWPIKQVVGSLLPSFFSGPNTTVKPACGGEETTERLHPIFPEAWAREKDLRSKSKSGRPGF